MANLKSLPTLAAVMLALSGAADAQEHHHEDQAAAGTAPAANGLVWLSETAPGVKSTSSGMDHNHAGAAAPNAGHDHSSVENAVADGNERMMNHAESKQLWLRSGTDPMKSPVAGLPGQDQILHIVGANGQVWDIKPESMNGALHAQIPLEEMGFYNAYLTRQAVVGDRLEVNVAKAELLKGTCCQKGIDPAQERPIHDSSQPIELVRDHMDGEKLFTRLVSGDKIGFTVLCQGKPLAGASVSMTTQQDWRKTQTSDANGRVEFTLIRDYFPAWTNFYRMIRQTFLVTADAEVSASGEYQGQPYRVVHYQTTLAGKYSPSPYDYRSYAYGLGISLGTVLFAGTAVYLYRRRRVRPFKEVRFHEAA